MRQLKKDPVMHTKRCPSKNDEIYPQQALEAAVGLSIRRLAKDYEFADEDNDHDDQTRFHTARDFVWETMAKSHKA